MANQKESGWIRRLSTWYFSKRMLPYWMILAMDAAIVFFSTVVYFLAGFRSLLFVNDNWLTMLAWAGINMVLSLVGARVFRTYSGVLRYSSFGDLLRLVYANTLTLGLALGVFYIAKWQEAYVPVLAKISPWVLLLVFMLSVLVMWTVRVMVKLLFDAVNTDARAKRTVIYGALSGGVGLAKSIRSQSPVKFELVAFISHEHKIKGKKLLGVPVYSLEDDIPAMIAKERVQAVLVSPLRANEFRENQQLQDIFINAGVKIYMASEAHEAGVRNGVLLDEPMEDVQIKEVSVEDLLPRQQIRVDMESVGEQLKGKRVMITGSAGSIGLEIVRQVAQFGPSKMMLVDQAETPQHDVRLMMAKDFPGVPCEVVVASISRRTRMENIFENFKPEYVFHAAAYKHVPMMEDNPSEAVLNNIYGTKIIADLSVKYGAKKFVMISTDKAVNPTNVMGCSKRICEIYVQSLDRKLKLQALSKSRGKRVEYTQFVTTRFGNVLGSNGSVIPLFREQIKNGGPVTVTDENIVRYFMLIPEACKLVLEAGTKGTGVKSSSSIWVSPSGFRTWRSA